MDVDLVESEYRVCIGNQIKHTYLGGYRDISREDILTVLNNKPTVHSDSENYRVVWSSTSSTHAGCSLAVEEQLNTAKIVRFRVRSFGLDLLGLASPRHQLRTLLYYYNDYDDKTQIFTSMNPAMHRPTYMRPHQKQGRNQSIVQLVFLVFLITFTHERVFDYTNCHFKSCTRHTRHSSRSQ